MRHFIARHKRWSALGVIALVPAVVAAAYMLATSNSSSPTQSVPIAAPAAVTLTVTTTLASPVTYPGGFNRTSWAYTERASATEDLTNPSANPVSVNALSLASWTSDKAGCNSAAFPALFVVTPVPINTTIAAGATITTPTITVAMVDDGLNDTVCAGATPTFVFATS